MAFIGDGVYQEISHHELMLIKADGSSDVWCFGYQPSTHDIAERAMKNGALIYAMCVQKVGEVYEVYDLKTLRKEKYLNTWTIGLPAATHENVDAAIMAAVLLT